MTPPVLARSLGEPRIASVRQAEAAGKVSLKVRLEEILADESQAGG